MIRTRIRSSLAALSFVVLAGFAVPALASDEQVEQDFADLREVPVNYTVFGTICEEVARLRLRDEFPAPIYAVDVGIQYKVGNRVIGELDVVVVRREDEKVILVAEVKCSSSMSQAARQAREQLRRFESTIYSRDRVVFSGREGRPIANRVDQFDFDTAYETISQEGGETAGFDRTIGLKLSEVNKLRARLMSCQDVGLCPR